MPCPALLPTQPTALTAALGFDTSILAGAVAASTQRLYQRDFVAYLHWAGSAQAALQPTTLAQWRAELANATTYSPHTINRMVCAVKHLMKEAAAQGHCSYETATAFHQVQGVKKKSVRTPIDISAAVFCVCRFVVKE